MTTIIICAIVFFALFGGVGWILNERWNKETTKELNGENTTVVLDSKRAAKVMREF